MIESGDFAEPYVDFAELYGDGIGYVAIVETMGDEWTPAEDARMSTGKGRLGPEKDNKLQVRLLKDAHTSPFEGVVIKVEVCAPLFVVKEIDRHRTLDKNSDNDEFMSPAEDSRKWFSRNEMSGRYTVLPDLYYHPLKLRRQSKTNNQGADPTPISQEVTEEFLRRGKELSKAARDLYSWAIENDVERGLARIYNLQNQYTKIRFTGSLKNWLDFLYLRLPKGVLFECNVVAKELLNMLRKKFHDPVTSWERLVYDTIKLDRSDRRFLAAILWDYKINSCVMSDSSKVDEMIKKLDVDKE